MSSSLSTKGLLNLFVVYLVWGSTYLFIRLTVQEGSGFPPFAMAASRTLCASVVLFGLAFGFKQRLRVSGPQLKVLIVSGHAAVDRRKRPGGLGRAPGRLGLCRPGRRHHPHVAGHHGIDPGPQTPVVSFDPLPACRVLRPGRPGCAGDQAGSARSMPLPPRPS